MVRKIEWRDWYHHSIVKTLKRNREDLRSKGITAETIIKDITRGEPRPWTETTAKKATWPFQRRARETIAAKSLPDCVFRIREKLKRWGVDIQEES